LFDNMIFFMTESLKAEAHASYKAAIEMMDHGKKEKVKLLYAHFSYFDACQQV